MCALGRHKSVSWLSHVRGAMNTGLHTVFLEVRPFSLPKREHIYLHPVSHIPEWIFLGDCMCKHIEIKLRVVSTGRMGCLSQK